MNAVHNPETVEIVAVIPELVAAGKLDEVEDVLIKGIKAMRYEVWDGQASAAALKALRCMSADQRSELITRLLAHFRDVSRSRPIILAWLIKKLSKRLDKEFQLSVLEAQLSHAAAFYEYFPFDRPIEWATAISVGGGTFTPEMIALVRRHQHRVKRTCREQLADFAEPALNAGEAWTDQVLAELPDLGENWRKLVDHAKTANPTRPSATWDRKATAMLAEIGHPEAIRRLTAWLRLVPRLRTVELELLPHFYMSAPFDPFNVVAACGLVWAASLLPADPELTRAIGGLVEPATVKVNRSAVRSFKLAGAAVFGLERIPGEDSARELERLEDKVVHGSVLKRIRVARALRR